MICNTINSNTMFKQKSELNQQTKLFLGKNRVIYAKNFLVNVLDILWIKTALVIYFSVKNYSTFKIEN